MLFGPHTHILEQNTQNSMVFLLLQLLVQVVAGHVLGQRSYVNLASGLDLSVHNMSLTIAI